MGIYDGICDKRMELRNIMESDWDKNIEQPETNELIYIYTHLFPKGWYPKNILVFTGQSIDDLGVPRFFFRLRKAPGDPPRHGLKSWMLEAAWIALRRSWEYFWMISSIWVRSKSSELVIWAWFFWGKFRKFEALEALEPLEPVRWGLKFDVQWRLSETWRPDSKLKKWWQGEMSRPHEPTRKGYGVLPEQKWILRILNASQTQQMSVFHFHQPFLKIFLGETHQALPFPSFPPDEHLETPDEPQHLPEADAVFTGEAHFLGHLLDFLLRKLAEIKFQDTSVYGEFLVSLWWVCEVDENETPEKHTLPWWMVMQRPRPSQMPPRWWGIRGASSLVAPGTDRWSMTIPSATSEYFWIVDDWLVVYLPLWKIW